MAKDDYDVVVFRILVYLYSVFKGKQNFRQNVFLKEVSRIDEEYLKRVLAMMSDEGLIEELHFCRAWGNVRILVNDLADMSITSDGIHYLLENNRMRKIKEFLLNQSGTMAGLIEMVIGG
ncbi:YjcQ family protein [uncultured Ligilactobacillus sp.]|mgnify:FL=1|uniref:YjcQ family protein n=1 Tax=uncultured Ligilactobacillus sp. TaxID=2837633 RepID=UPI00258AE3FA|nr:YjcQ family protein [uncultured Ligilactobacillus sp.]